MEENVDLSYEQLLDVISEETENKQREKVAKDREKENNRSCIGPIFFSDEALLASLMASNKILDGEVFLGALEYEKIFKALCVINPICRSHVAHPVHEVCVRLAGTVSERGAEILLFDPYKGGWTFRKGEDPNMFGWIDVYSNPIRKYKNELIEYSNSMCLALMADNAEVARQKLQELTKGDNILKVFNNIINADCFDEHFNTKEKVENFKANVLAIIIANTILEKSPYSNLSSLTVNEFNTVVNGLKIILPNNEKLFDKVKNNLENELIYRFDILDYKNSFEYNTYEEGKELNQINSLWGLLPVGKMLKEYVPEIKKTYYDKLETERQEKLGKLKKIIYSFDKEFTESDLVAAIKNDELLKKCSLSGLWEMIVNEKLVTERKVVLYSPAKKVEDKKQIDTEEKVV